MTQLNAQGLLRSRLDERLAALTASMHAIFGLDLNLDPDSVDGQALGIFAESVSNLDQLIEDVYHSFNPQSASGLALSRLVQLNGIRRIAGLASTVTLHCTGTAGTIIPANSLVKSTATNVTFATLAEAALDGTGQANIAAQATVTGALLAPSGTLTKIDTPIYGWQTVTNILDAAPGRDEETDAALRLRRRASTSTPGQSILDAIYGTLSNIPSVRQALVLENSTDATDGNGLPPHSIYCIVNGGLDQDIWNAIWLKKTVGATMVGTVSGTVTDSMGGPHTIKFSRPTATNIYVTVNLHAKPGWPTDGVARMQAAIVAWALANQTIGQEVIHSRVFDPVNSVPGESVDSLYIGTSASPTGVVNIAVPFDGLAIFDISRIVVNVT